MLGLEHKRIFLLLAMLFLLLPAIGQSQVPITPQSLSSVTFVDNNGQRYNLAAYRGRPILIHLWATWCAPCVQEIPALVRLQSAYQPYGLVLLPISEDFDTSSIIDFFSATGISNLPVLLDPESRLFASLGTKGLPISILIDRYGREVRRFAGNTPWDSPEVRTLLNSLLAAPSPAQGG